MRVYQGPKCRIWKVSREDKITVEAATHLFLAHGFLDHFHTLQGRQARHEVGVGLSCVEGSRVGRAPDSPALVQVVPAEVLDDNVLHAVLFLRGDRNNLGVGSTVLCLGRSCGLAACDAHDNLTDAGFREIGDGCCAV
jgi:hypothetical protein